MPSDDSSAAKGPPFSRETAELSKQLDLVWASFQNKALEAPRATETWATSEQKKFEDLGQALGMSARAAMDLTNVFARAAEAAFPKQPEQTPGLEELYAATQGELAAFRWDLPADPVLCAVELVERGDELAASVEALVRQALKEREGVAWMKRVMLSDLMVSYRSATQDLLFTMSARRSTPSRATSSEWYEALSSQSPQIEQGFIPVAVLEHADQGLALKQTVVQIAKDLAAGPEKYMALLRGPGELCL